MESEGRGAVAVHRVEGRGRGDPQGREGEGHVRVGIPPADRRAGRGGRVSAEVVMRENVTPYLRVVGDRLRDLAPVLAPLVDDIHGYFGEQFETSGAAGGSRWADL